MSDELEMVLRLVAEGRLSAEEAAPLVEALTRAAQGHREPGPAAPTRGGGAATSSPRHLRVRVRDAGRTVVNLRVPLAFAEMALGAVPGMGADQGERIRAAIAAGVTGPILDVEDPDGDGVLITLE